MRSNTEVSEIESLATVGSGALVHRAPLALWSGASPTRRLRSGPVANSRANFAAPDMRSWSPSPGATPSTAHPMHCGASPPATTRLRHHSSGAATRSPAAAPSARRCRCARVRLLSTTPSRTPCMCVVNNSLNSGLMRASIASKPRGSAQMGLRVLCAAHARPHSAPETLGVGAEVCTSWVPLDS